MARAMANLWPRRQLRNSAGMTLAQHVGWLRPLDGPLLAGFWLTLGRLCNDFGQTVGRLFNGFQLSDAPFDFQ